VFFAGATGGVGKRVVQTLLNKGKAVRALVRDEQKARKLLVRVHKTYMSLLSGALVQQHKPSEDHHSAMSRCASICYIMARPMLPPPWPAV